MRNRTPFILSLIGGIMLISVSAVGNLGFWGIIIGYITSTFPETADVMVLVLGILMYIAGLGGVGVIIGGALLTTNRVGTGKFVIGISAGLGLIGLIIYLAELYMAGGITLVLDMISLLSQSVGWIGAILSIVARQMASKPE
ncbi:MAG: hypothetical protein EAX81_08430 [Candidatus Thorarchaeota archaeon]|nr:hypothetical protein [Candidatus Thorarchaeota archaeon]